MTEISGKVVIILKDGLGVEAGEVAGVRKTDFGDFIVLESGGSFDQDGALVENQVDVGKIEFVVLEDHSALSFSTNRVESAQAHELPEDLTDAQEGEPEGGAEAAIVNPEELPTLSSEPAAAAIEDGEPAGDTPASGEESAGEEQAGEAQTSEAQADGDDAQADDAQAGGDDAQADGDGAQVAVGATEPAAASDEQAPAKKAPRAKKTS